MRRNALLFMVTAVILAAMVWLLSMEMLPAAPTSPTPTWPMGIDLPEKLPRIPR